MENEKKEDCGKEGKKCCGIRCGCCVCSVVKAVVLLAIGFFLGRHCGMICSSHKMEKVEVTTTVEATAPAPTAAKKK